MYKHNEDSTTMTADASNDSSLCDSLRTHVSFDDQMTVRYYPTVLGDNPSVTDGPPVSIGWDFTTEKMSLTDTSQGSNSTQDYYLDGPARIERLLKNGFSQQEMDVAYAEVYFVQRLRKINASISARSSSLGSSSLTRADSEDLSLDGGLPWDGEEASDRCQPARTRNDGSLWTAKRHGKRKPRRSHAEEALEEASIEYALFDCFIAPQDHSRPRPKPKKIPQRTSLFSSFRPLARVNKAISKRASSFSKAMRCKKPKSSLPPAA